MTNRYRQLRVSTYTPEVEHIAIADRRTSGFIQAWVNSEDKDLQVLVRSAYLQGLADMADAAAQMQERLAEND